MKAIVQDRYGSADVLEFQDIDEPTLGEGDVLVRVHAAGCGPDVWHLMTGMPYMARVAIGLRRPKVRVRGWDVAGTVEAVGAKVTDFQPGDEVMGTAEDGSFAELAVTPANKLVRKPANLTFEQAAALPISGTTALRALRDVGNVQPGQRVLVIGAAGGVGTLAVQLAKGFGAHVTGVGSTSKQDLIRSLGVDEVIDYTKEDFAENGETYDVILDAVGKQSFFHCRRSLRPGGLYVATDRLLNLVLLLWTRWFGKRRVVFGMPRLTKDNVHFVKELIEAGRYRAVVDRTYPLEDVVEATRYVESWQKTGNVVLTVNGSA
jgi:NADPH:quinone reductase-like Zn-dependent oxidoreductase